MSAAADRDQLARLLLDVLLDPAAPGDYASVTADTLAEAVWAAGWRPNTDTDAYHAEMQKLRVEREALDG